MKTLLTAFAAIVVAASALVLAAPASSATAVPEARVSIPTGFQDCHLKTKWKKMRLVGSCGSKKIKVKANGYDYSRITGRVYGKKFNVKYSGNSASSIRDLSGVAGGLKLRTWGSGWVNTVERTVDGNNTNVRVTLGFKGNKGVECSAQGTITGPASVNWTSSTFERISLSGSRPLSGSHKLWGACATVIASQTAFNGT